MSVYYDITGTSRICHMCVRGRYLWALVILDQSLRNSAEGSDSTSELSMFAVRRNPGWFLNSHPWLAESIGRGRYIIVRILGSSSSLGHRLCACSPGPWPARSRTFPPPQSGGSLPGCRSFCRSSVSSWVCVAE